MTDLARPLADLTPAARPTRWPALGLTTEAISLAALAGLTGVLYLVNLTVSGFANTYYAMAAQAAGRSWSALFFGALDSQGFITTDKPPLATALMGLSVKVFGLSSWSVLLPQALLGAGTVLVLYLAVRRSFGSRAALLAGVLMALSPVAVLIFRYDNPDALLTFLLVSAAWALGRGLEAGRLRWVLLAATLIGLGFLTKYLQAWVVLPAFALTWLVCAPGSVRRRAVGLGAAAIAVAASSLWWVAVVELLPIGSRPYIGGSTTNSALELLLGYDGLGRIFGNRPAGSGLGSALDGLLSGSAGNGGPGGASFGGNPGLFRLVNDVFGGQIAWLLPAALLSIGAAVAIHRRTARIDARVGGYVLWSTWLLVHAVVFSFMSGIIHPYYTVILAPAIAALVGGTAVALWDRRRDSSLAGAALAVGVAISGATAWILLDRTPDFLPGLGIAILALALAAAILIAVPAEALRPMVSRAAVGMALVAVLAGPIAYAGVTMQTAYGGGDPGAGPQVSRGFFGGNPGSGSNGANPGSTGQALIDYLVANQGSAKWLVAANSSMVAAGIQLSSGQPVMTMGGFTGSDPTPTVDDLRAAIAAGDLRYVLVGGGGGPGGGFAGGGFGGDGTQFGPAGGPGGSNAVATSRTSWVLASCTQVTIGGAATGLYDCADAA